MWAGHLCPRTTPPPCTCHSPRSQWPRRWHWTPRSNGGGDNPGDSCEAVNCWWLSLSTEIILSRAHLKPDPGPCHIERTPVISENFLKVFLSHQMSYHGQFALENPPSELSLLNYINGFTQTLNTIPIKLSVPSLTTCWLQSARLSARKLPYVLTTILSTRELSRTFFLRSLFSQTFLSTSVWSPRTWAPTWFAQVFSSSCNIIVILPCFILISLTLTELVLSLTE